MKYSFMISVTFSNELCSIYSAAKLLRSEFLNSNVTKLLRESEGNPHSSNSYEFEGIFQFARVITTSIIPN